MDQETKDFFQGLIFGMEKRFDGVEQRFDLIEKRFDGVTRRLDVLESEVRGVNTSVGHVKRYVSSVENRLITLVLSKGYPRTLEVLRALARRFYVRLLLTEQRLSDLRNTEVRELLAG